MKKLTSITLFISVCLLFLFSSAIAQTLIDNRGRNISFDKPFGRIISLYSAHTENLYHINASNQIIGVSINDDYPSDVKEKQTFSYHDGPEKYLAARPDLVLIRPMIDNGYPQFVRQLESYGIIVASFQPATIDDMYAYWTALGKLTGKTKEAGKMVSDFQKQVADIKKRCRQIPDPKHVYFQAIHKRMKTFTPGSMTIFALETAGGINVANDAVASRNTNVAIYSKERILSKAESIDVILSQSGIMNPVTITDILNEPGFQIIKAVKNRQVFLIDEGIVSRPVFRLLDGIYAIGNILYPELF